MKLNMMFGVASSAAQIEGGGVRHNWSDWYKKGHIKDGSSPARADDHWRRWREDIDLMAELGIETYRFGIEWARLEPSRGKYDEAAAAQYREMILYMREKGILPLMTIHHFTNPLWLEEAGGFENPEAIGAYLGFVEYAIKAFGDLVDEYVTINEPNVFAVFGYFSGEFPPGKKSPRSAFRVMSVMAACHIGAYGLIHRLRKEMGYANTKVGFAHHMQVFDPKDRNSPWQKFCARRYEQMFQGAVTKAFLTGIFNFPLKPYGRILPGEYADFIGLNYYSRLIVTDFKYDYKKDAPHNDLGWEIYPRGIARCAEKLYKQLPRPIYITENGTCDNEDAFRCRYIYDHLRALKKSSLPVERYYHWCFTDNFEWCEGESARFGLVHVDYETQKRTIKKSGRFFADMIKNKGVTREMFDEHVAGVRWKYGKDDHCNG